MAQCGRFILRIGTHLSDAVKKATLVKTTLDPNARASVIDAKKKDKYCQLEAYLREKLVEMKVYGANFLPDARYPPT